MRIIVINLDRAPERLARMAAQLTGLGLTFDRLPASDGRALTAADRARVDHRGRKAISAYPLSDNEIGCWLSHLRAMQSLLDSGDAMAAILEDDAALTAETPAVLSAIAAMDRAFDAIDLHRLFNKHERFVPVLPLLPNLALGRVGYTHMRLTAYVISRAGAETFLAQSASFAHAVDKALHRYWDNGLDLYGLERPVAAQDDGGISYIEETRAQERPAERPRYTDAGSLRWQAARRIEKWRESYRKRRAFEALIRSR
jgi:glycosyl transferase family 25